MSVPGAIHDVTPMPAPLGSFAFPIDIDLMTALEDWRISPTDENLFEIVWHLLQLGLYDFNFSDQVNASIWLCRYDREIRELIRRGRHD